MSEKPELDYLEINICEKCNLNCKGCSHFAPLVKDEKKFDFEGYKNDIIRLSNIFSNIKLIRLLGGEPLLNDKIIDIIELTRNIFKNSDIHIVTNCTKLMRMSKEFFKCLAVDNIQLDISYYPIMKISKQRLISFLKSKGIRYYLYEVKKFAARLNLKGDYNGIENSKKCMLKCVTLREGKMYRCSILGNIFKFQDYFGQGIVESDEGGIVDIYKYDGTEIIKRLEETNKLCSYCTGNCDIEFDWALSEKRIEEWCTKARK